MKRTASLIAVVLLSAHALFGADETFKPSGSPFAKIFFNTNYNLGDQGSAMEINRAYLGYKYNMSENFSGKINVDVGDPDVSIGDTLKGKTNSHYTAFLKNAYATYKYGKLTVDAGMIPINQFLLSDDIWAHRYIMKPFQDENKMGTSADLGFSASYQFAEFLSTDLTVYNGEGYKNLEMDDAYRTGLGFTLTPVKGLTLRGYYDYTERKEVMFTMSHLISYQWEDLTLGAEYTTQSNNNDVVDHDLAGIDAFMLYNLTEQIELFVRYNDLNSNKLNGQEKSWNYAKDNKMLVGGVQFTPHKSVKIALNYQGVMADKPGNSSDRIFLNFQYSF